MFIPVYYYCNCIYYCDTISFYFFIHFIKVSPALQYLSGVACKSFISFPIFSSSFSWPPKRALEPIPAAHGWRQGTSLNETPAHPGPYGSILGVRYQGLEPRMACLQTELPMPPKLHNYFYSTAKFALSVLVESKHVLMSAIFLYIITLH